MDWTIGQNQGGVFNCGGLHWVEGLRVWKREKERDIGGRGIKFLFQLIICESSFHRVQVLQCESA